MPGVNIISKITTSKITVLLTGAGGVATPFLIHHLMSKGYRVLTADMDPHATGLFLADRGFVIPKADDRNFLSAIRRLCSEENVNVIIPLVDEELLPISDLEQTGLIILAPRKEFIELCLDKFRLAKTLETMNIPVPETRLACDGPGNLAFPCVVKPRTGRGSREVEILGSEKAYEDWLTSLKRSSDAYILQEYISGTEFTISVVVWRDGRIQAVLPKKIISKRGITHLAITEHNEKIEKYCTQIQEKLHADGPFNVQLRCEQNTGNPLLFEINPRYSTTTSLTIGAGIDEIHGLIVQAVKGYDAYTFGNWKEGLVLFRQNIDYFYDEKDFYMKSKNIRKIV
jgi:carbamoyl-phosphate synthase large subunit